MCASSLPISSIGNVPTGTPTGKDRWWSSPVRRRCSSGPAPDLHRHTASVPGQSMFALRPRRYASLASRWHRPESSAGPAHESPCDRVSPPAPTGRSQCRADFHGRSVGRRPSPGIAPRRSAFAHGDRHHTAQPAGRRSSRERTPSTARTRSGRHTLRSPGGNLAAWARQQFKSTPPFFARKVAELLAFLVTPLQLTGQQ